MSAGRAIIALAALIFAKLAPVVRAYGRRCCSGLFGGLKPPDVIEALVNFRFQGQVARGRFPM